MIFPNCKICLSMGVRKFSALTVLCLSSVCWAQAANGTPVAPSHRSHAPSNSTPTKVAPTANLQTKAAHRGETAPAAAAQPAAAGGEASTANPPQPVDAAPKPAVVRLQSGKLTVRANDADLSQILDRVASMSGMKIDGLNESARVFGAYGPGNPQDVLAKLLDGSGYDFMMVGNMANGAPSQLILTAKKNSPPALNSASSGPAASSTSSGNDRAQAPQPSAAEPSPPQESDEPAEAAPSPQSAADADAEPPGPGAVLHPPPPAATDPEQRMRQNMQRLQKMQQQQQQNAPQ